MQIETSRFRAPCRGSIDQFRPVNRIRQTVWNRSFTFRLSPPLSADKLKNIWAVRCEKLEP